jgi:hypothetical protein
MPTKCKSCSNITPTIQKYNMDNYLCYLCNISKIFVDCGDILDYSDNILICISDLKQSDIINKTYKYLKLNNRIPFPEEIDEKVIKLDYPVYIFYETYKKMNEREKSKFDVKIFFTNVIDRNLLKIKKMTDPYYPIEKINIKYHENKKKFIDDKLNVLYMKYNSLFINNKYI